MQTLRTKDPAACAGLLRAGELAGVPTETVYGLAGNGLDTSAVEKIYAVKGRPAVKPLSLLVSGPEALSRWCRAVPAGARALAEKFWPGPLTLVLPAAEAVPSLVRAGGNTVGLRCPAHPDTLALLKMLDFPLAAPSANPSGAESPKTAADVLRYFDGKIAAVLDGGPCTLGRESTLFDMSQTPYRVLRQGALSEADIDSALVDAMTILGITGGTGCGKTTALETVEALGGLVIDCDKVYHDLTVENGNLLTELQARFPGVVVDGVLQRKALGEIVFSDSAALLDLNAITHRYVGEAVDAALTAWARAGGTLAAIDAIALLESGMGKKCRAVVGITAPVEARIQRLVRREGITKDYARLRIAAQKDDAYFAQNCDYILHNDGTKEDFQTACLALLRQLIPASD